jgi:hypothetical protein
MYTYQSRKAVTERDSMIAMTHREARSFMAESVFDPTYERATAALRRWVDGMEAALAKAAPRAREVLR